MKIKHDMSTKKIEPKESETTVDPKAGKKKFENHLIITKSDDPRAKWYVVHTYSGHEAKVMANLKQRVETMKLADRILEVLVPTQEQIQIRSGKKHNVTEKIFPGYILVRMIVDDASWLAVRTTQGVTGFVGVGNKPTPISDDEVKTIQKFMSLEAPKYQSKFSVGEAVKIVDGPFADFLGSIDSIDEEKGKVRVLVSIFGRETPVELDFLQVKKL
ncbi:MAG: transcription termination/antitermination protein NusG [Patescibacteria group bacterium]|nr:transcription termination/antitermination protein NusG [Patescibacteria group bacterium]